MALTIANLSVDKELDRAEMGAVRGGSIFQNNGVNANYNGGFSFGSPQTNVAPVTQVDASQHTKVDLTTISNSINNLGGLVKATQF
jgi:hypothetical protein